MRFLGIDFGDRRVGIAISDPLGVIAQGLETIEYTDQNELFAEIEAIVDRYEIEKFIVGMPYHMNGSLGERAEKTKEFINSLEKRFDIPIEEEDERLTSSMAHRTRIKMGKKLKHNKTKKGKIDKMAATILLQGYLNRIK